MTVANSNDFGIQFFTPSGGGGTPAHITAAIPGQWTAIGPAAGMASVAFGTSQFTWPGAATGFGSLMTDWSGGCYDPTTHRLYIHGGGHHSYDGNEWYAFKLDTATWMRVDAPSLYDPEPPPTGPSTGGGTGVFADGSPIMIHTYDELGVVPTTGKLYRVLQGGANGTQMQNVWEYNPANANPNTVFPKTTWVQKAATTGNPGSTGCSCVWAADEGVFYIPGRTQGSNMYYAKYNPTSNTWTNLNTTGAGATVSMTAAYSASRRIVVAFKSPSLDVNNAAQLEVLNCNTLAVTRVANVGIPEFIAFTQVSPGKIEYDPIRDRFIVYSDANPNDRRQLWSINPATWTSTLVQPPGGDLIPAPVNGPYNGIFGRFRYCADYDVYIAVNRVDSKVYLYKPIVNGFYPGSVGWSPP